MKMEEQEEQLTTSAVPKVMPKKSFARKHTDDVKTEDTGYNNDKTLDSSSEGNNNTITII